VGYQLPATLARTSQFSMLAPWEANQY